MHDAVHEMRPVAAVKTSAGHPVIRSSKCLQEPSDTVSYLGCLGSCGLAPILIVDDETLGKETPESTAIKVREALASVGKPNGAKPKVEEDEEVEEMEA